jgi:hypothetical protein
MGLKSEWQFNHTHQPSGLAVSVAPHHALAARVRTAEPTARRFFDGLKPAGHGNFLHCGAARTQGLQCGGWKALRFKQSGAIESAEVGQVNGFLGV